MDPDPDIRIRVFNPGLMVTYSDGFIKITPFSGPFDLSRCLEEI